MLTALSSNGRTQDSGSCYHGSSPCGANIAMAKRSSFMLIAAALFFSSLFVFLPVNLSTAWANESDTMDKDLSLKKERDQKIADEKALRSVKKQIALDKEIQRKKERAEKLAKQKKKRKLEIAEQKAAKEYKRQAALNKEIQRKKEGDQKIADKEALEGVKKEIALERGARLQKEREENIIQEKADRETD